MNAPRLLACLALAALGGCAKRDPFDDPEYAAACHGLPLETIEERQKAYESGYSVNARFGCIEKGSWEEAQRANAMVADMLAKAEREAKDAASRPPRSLADERQGFHTAIHGTASGQPLPKPPANLFVRADYDNSDGRSIAAFVSPDPGDGRKHAAIVWITGGDSNTLDDFWTPGPPDNDQSASALREAGVVMMFPTLRGGNTDTGAKEYFYGEVDDIHAASNALAKLPYVDPARVYLGGHSTGGTLALLAAETGGRFAAVFAFGPVSRIDHYPDDLFPSGGAAAREIELRSPRSWLDAVSTPTYLIEGGQAPSNASDVQELCGETRNDRIRCVIIPDANHFSALNRVNSVLGPRLAAGAPGETTLLQPTDFAGEPPGR